MEKVISLNNRGDVHTLGLDSIESHIVREAATTTAMNLILAVFAEKFNIKIEQNAKLTTAYDQYSNSGCFSWLDCRYKPEYAISPNGEKPMRFSRETIIVPADKYQGQPKEETKYIYRIENIEEISMLDAGFVQCFFLKDACPYKCYARMRIDAAMETARRLGYKPILDWEWDEKSEYWHEYR